MPPDSTARSLISWREVLADGAMRRILAAYFAVHAALFLAVPDWAGRMLLGDRAGDRLRALDQLGAADGLDARLAVLLKVGSAGDYILFWPAYAIAGRAGILAQSLALYAIGLVALFIVARRLLGREGAIVAAIAWMVLPATLFHPHALVSEAICNPVLALLVLALLRLYDAERPQPLVLLGAGLLTAVLVLVRHVYLLLPLAVLLWLAIFRPRGMPGRLRGLPLYAAASFALIAVWWGAMALGSLRHEVGKSVGGLESNLFLRVERMAYLGGIELPQSYRERSARAGRELRTLEPREMLSMATARPDLFLRTAAADAFNMMANPGVAMLAGRYLGLFDLGERNHRDLNKWRETREKEGIAGLVRLLLATSPLGLVLNAAGVVVWGVFLLLAAAGGARLLADASEAAAVRWLIAGLPLYVLCLTSVTAGYTRWDHRSPMEIVLSIAFASAVLAWRRRQGRGHRVAHAAAPAMKG